MSAGNDGSASEHRALLITGLGLPRSAHVARWRCSCATCQGGVCRGRRGVHCVCFIPLRETFFFFFPFWKRSRPGEKAADRQKCPERAGLQFARHRVQRPAPQQLSGGSEREPHHNLLRERRCYCAPPWGVHAMNGNSVGLWTERTQCSIGKGQKA